MDKNLTLDDAVEFLVDIQGAFNRTDQQQICNDICHDKVLFIHRLHWGWKYALTSFENKLFSRTNSIGTHRVDL